jgi:hypothetical protein
MEALSGGLPAETSDDISRGPSEAWGAAPTVTRQLGASPPIPPVAPSANHMDATLNSSNFSNSSMDQSLEVVADEIDEFLLQEGMPKGPMPTAICNVESTRSLDHGS